MCGTKNPTQIVKSYYNQKTGSEGVKALYFFENYRGRTALWSHDTGFFLTEIEDYEVTNTGHTTQSILVLLHKKFTEKLLSRFCIANWAPISYDMVWLNLCCGVICKTGPGFPRVVLSRHERFFSRNLGSKWVCFCLYHPLTLQYQDS